LNFRENLMFWDVKNRDSGNLAVIDEHGRHISYSELFAHVDAVAEQLSSRGGRQLGLLFISNTLSSLVAYLACLRARHVALLLPAGMAPELVASLQTHYRPNWIIGAHVQGIPLAGTDLSIAPTQQASSDPQLSPDLALLLSTSGSTGSPKLVRLSYSNLQCNAESIAQYLGLTSDERALTILPFHYSYGLSIVNSHLHAGSCLVLREVSVLTPAFGETIRAHAVTSISGVPYIYQMLWRTGFNKQDFPSLRTLTQAGGRLDDKLTTAFARLADERRWRFFVMYGQTEATARISYVPPDRLLEKIGSVGIAIPGGQLHIDPENAELLYSGPNVMLGYATCREDLARGDEQNGLLRTGDLARQDDEGFFYITGRLKRFVKLAGNRIGLDEVEQQLQHQLGLHAMVSGRDERLVVWIETTDEASIEQVRQWLANQFGIHHSMCRFRQVESLPKLSSGKNDYSALLADT
jgi:acyl-CoA synthetase (AMP-forming)/AMP-acid ligase II